MKTIILPDIHHRWQWVESFLDGQEYDEVVFLGDFFDDFGDDSSITRETALFVKRALYHPKWKLCLGNHDLLYIFAANLHRTPRWMQCSGNSLKKALAIREVLSLKDRDRFYLLVKTQGFILSHAGISEYHFAHPRRGYEDIEEICSRALERAKTGIYDPILGAGLSRGGNEVVGGILWQDWFHDFVPISGINQIVGHTVCRLPHENSLPDSVNWCIDTNSRHYAVIDNGELSIIER